MSTSPAPTPAEPLGELVYMDPADLVVGTNVRLDPRLDKDFIESIRTYGILEPIIASRVDGQVVVRLGQRRTLAAVQCGRTSEPVVITQAADDETMRIITQVIENVQRSDLSTTDHIEAHRQLDLLGLTSAQIAKSLGTKRAVIERSLRAGKSELATRAAARYDFLTLDQAATIAEFEDDTETVKALVAAAQTGQFDHVAQRARDKRAEAAAIEAFAESLRAEGITVVKPFNWSDPTGRYVEDLHDADGNEMTVEAHKSCPGHAAFVTREENWVEDEDGNERGEEILSATYVCTDFKANGHVDRYGQSSGRTSSKPTAAEMSEEDREAARVARRDVIESNKAWDSAQTVRREWVKQFLTRKTAPKGSAAMIATSMFANAGDLSHYNIGSVVEEFLGMTKSWGDTTSAETIAAASDARATVIALGYVLAAHEGQTSRDSWRSVNPGTARYLTFLAANGYELSDVETRATGTDSPSKAGR